MEQTPTHETDAQQQPGTAGAPQPQHARTPARASDSEPTLRFPKAAANRQLATWVSTSNPNIMEASSFPDDAALAESEYALINTDEESHSQDDHLSESVSSLNYARADDLQSLDGTENTFDTNDDGSAPANAGNDADDHGHGDDHDEDEDEEEAEDEEDGEQTDTDSDSEGHDAEVRSESDHLVDHRDRHSSFQSIQYAEESLQSPSSPASSSAVLDPTPMNRSIELQEAGELPSPEAISVKHTICEFDEASSALIAGNLNVAVPPKRLVATVRQTMSHNCLSTREPLRVLYVGSEIARHDIIYKISSTLMASTTSSLSTTSSDTGIYTVVPISAFGSAQLPDVELLKTSASECQIKVEVCTSAEAAFFRTQSGAGFSGSVTVDGERRYHSIRGTDGQSIEPAWEVPHVAIFYITENDDAETCCTRDAACEFMAHHKVPSIFISNARSFEDSLTGAWRRHLDGHAIHLCLESKGSERSVPCGRYPIDLATFLHIDARQMNRNLAYLTGLQEPLAGQKAEGAHLAGSGYLLESAKFVRRVGEELPKKVAEFTPQTWLYLLGVFMAVLIGFAMNRSGMAAPSVVPLPTADDCLPTSPAAVSTSTILVSTSTVTINLTSTKTIQIPQAKSSSSGFAVSTFSSQLPEYHAELSGKKTVCSAQVLSKTEILVKIPLSTKTSWLAKDSIFIDVFRAGNPIKTKFSSIDEGIIIEIPKKEAYGIMNVMVTTTRRPKVNETFSLDFGKGLLGESIDFGKLLFQDVSSRVQDAASSARRQVEEAVPDLASARQALSQKVGGISADVASIMQNARSTWSDRRRDAELLLEKRKLSVQEARDRIETTVLRAQVNAKLWWLKIQRKSQEHDEYRRKAEAFVSGRLLEATKRSGLRVQAIMREVYARQQEQRAEARCRSGLRRWRSDCRGAA